MEVKDKKIVIIGAEKTGKALSRVLYSLGAHITLMDQKEGEKINRQKLDNLKIEYYLGGYNKEVLSEADLIILSPGVPPSIEELNTAREKGIKITGEVEVAYNLFPCQKIIAVSGTDGKTTTTTLIYEMFKNANASCQLAGNIGFPAIEVLPKTSPDDYIILEISSFQLETVEKFKPKISVLLNIAEDHLDRHKTLKNYIDCKARIFSNQSKSDWTVLNYDNEITRALSDRTKAEVIFFSQETILKKGVFVKEGKIVANILGKKEEIIPLREIKILGKHNIENSLAAISSALLCNLDVGCIAETLRNFPGIAHRQEEVGDTGGIKFINDSKATTPNSAIAALRRFTEPIILIAGGREKGADLSSWAQEISHRVKKLILLGESKEKIAEEVKKKDFYNFEFASDMQTAVDIAWKNARRGDVILLSPACSSFDLFNNYEERGDTFKKIVEKIKKNGKEQKFYP